MFVRNLLLVTALAAAANLIVSAHKVDTVRVAGPYSVLKPVMIDSVDA